MKILYTVDYSSFRGGASKSTLILAEEMSKRGNEVIVLCPDGVVIKGAGFNYIKVKAFKDEFPFLFQNPLQKLKLVRTLEKEICRINPDIIHVQMPRAGRAIGFGRILGKYKTCRIVYTERELVSRLGLVYKVLYSLLIAKPYDGIVCLSQTATKFWRENGSKRVIVIPNSGGKIYENYDPFCIKKAYDILKIDSGNMLNVLFAGRMTPEKRWNLVYDIISEANKEEVNARFFVALSYVDNDQEAFELINRLKTFSNVIVFENVPFEKMEYLYYVADIHIMTSNIESFGRTLIEAMGRRTVVISTDAGPTREIIGEDYIIEPFAYRFVEKIKEFDRDREKLETVKDEMMKLYRKKYSLKTLGDNHEAFYQDILNNGRYHEYAMKDNQKNDFIQCYSRTNM